MNNDPRLPELLQHCHHQRLRESLHAWTISQDETAEKRGCKLLSETMQVVVLKLCGMANGTNVQPLPAYACQQMPAASLFIPPQWLYPLPVTAWSRVGADRTQQPGSCCLQCLSEFLGGIATLAGPPLCTPLCVSSPGASLDSSVPDLWRLCGDDHQIEWDSA